MCLALCGRCVIVEKLDLVVEVKNNCKGDVEGVSAVVVDEALFRVCEDLMVVGGQQRNEVKRMDVYRRSQSTCLILFFWLIFLLAIFYSKGPKLFIMMER